WLDDHGLVHRAAFVRAQLHLSETGATAPPSDEGPLIGHFGLSRCAGGWHCPSDSPSRRRLAFNCRSLLDQHEELWLAPVRGLLRRDWTWSRGFLETVDVDPGSLAAAGVLFENHPIQRLVLTGLRGDVGSLALIPADNRLR